MTERIPNLFLVGAMRAGTTAFHEALGHHPDIFMSEFKEPAFFADPRQLAADSRIVSDAGYAGDRRRYLELFRAAGNSRYIGESSTHYTKLPRITDVSERIANMVGDPRIVYLVRAPIERTLSHYRYAVRMKDESRPCLIALQSDPIYCSVSDYARQIEPFFEQFGRDRVHIAVLEDLIADPSSEFDRLFSWLDVETPQDAIPFLRRNAVGSVSRSSGPELLHRIGQSPVYQRVARHAVPERLRGSVRRRLHRPMPADEVRHPDVLEYLHAVHDPQVEAFEAMAGRPFRRWKR